PAFWGAGWRLLRMQIRRLSGLRRVTLDPVEKCSARRQTPRQNVADKPFAFHDGDVRLSGNGDEIIGSISTQGTGRSEVKRNCNLVDSFSIQVHRSNRATNKRTLFNSPRRATH